VGAPDPSLPKNYCIREPSKLVSNNVSRTSSPRRLCGWLWSTPLTRQGSKVIITRLKGCFFFTSGVLEIHQEKRQDEECTSYAGSNVLCDFSALF